jgi:hypothetical protein
MGMGIRILYPYLFYPVGMIFFPFTYAWVIFISYPCLDGFLPDGYMGNGYPLSSFKAWWQSTVLATLAVRRGTSSVIMLTAWWLWKRRNMIIFDGA